MPRSAKDFVMGFAVPSGRWCGNCSFRYQTHYAGREKEERCFLFGVLQGEVTSINADTKVVATLRLGSVSSDDWKDAVAFVRADTCLKRWPEGGIAEVMTAKRKVTA